MIKVAINGFGRIGRAAFKIAFDHHHSQCQVVAINDLTDNPTLAHLLKYDSTYGRWHNHTVEADDEHLIVDRTNIKALAEPDPTKLPWRELEVDVVVESTGRFVKTEDASKHLKAGAKRVVISAPSKGDQPAPTHVLGVNEYNGKAKVINNASCTTNSISPIMAVLDSAFGVENGLMTTVHAYTADQNLQDAPHKDLRRARAAGHNIVPTSTGAALATTEAMPQLKGKFDGIAVRVPVIVGSVSDVTVTLKKKATVEQINQAFKQAAENPIYKGVLEVTEDPIVSTDIIGSKASVIVDLGLTKVVGNLAKIFGWYDNESGYANRLVEQAIVVGSFVSGSKRKDRRPSH